MSAIEMSKHMVAAIGALLLTATSVAAAASAGPAHAIETAPQYAASQAADQAQA
jgi:hypothetical protein